MEQSRTLQVMPDAGSAVATKRWPPYLVTAPHRVVSAPNDDHAWLPFGEWHARKVGASQTMCGRSAVTWSYFWTLAFNRASPESCHECVRAIDALRLGARPPAGPRSQREGA